MSFWSSYKGDARIWGMYPKVARAIPPCFPELEKPKPLLSSVPSPKKWCLRYLEGQGDLVSRLSTPITHIVNPVIPLIKPVTKSP